MRAGLEAFTGDAVAIVMADGSDSPRDLVAYQRLLEEGYECAFGSRFVSGSTVTDYPRTKLIMNRIVNFGIRLLFRHGYNDTTNAFKAYRREVIENVQPFLSHHFNLTVELPLKAVVRGYSYGIVPISWTNRPGRRLEAEAERDGQPLPVHRPLRLPRAPPEPRRLPAAPRPLIAFLRTTRGAWIALGAAMAASAALILATAHGESFGIDEMFYLGRMVEDSGQVVQHHSLDLGYLLGPYNGHLQLGGKLIYEATFALFGADYTAFILVNVAALCASVALIFELARRRIGPLAALAPCVLLLFLGFAREVLLWPFDVHTLAALAFGLGAYLALERNDRLGDVLACALLTASVATIEVGISLLVGIAVLVLLQRDRWRRVWIFVVPAALYAAWWIWARKFHQDQSALSIENLHLIPKTVYHAAAAALGALTGTNPVIPATYNTVVTWFGKGLAVLAAFAVGFRLWRGRVPKALWAWLAVLLFYWVTMGAAARPPEGSRYLFFGAVGILLVGAEALRGRAGNRVTAGIVIVVLLALPANIAQLRSGANADTLHHDAGVSRTEFAMLELAGNRVDPEYVASADPNVAAAGGSLYIGIPAGAYLRFVQRSGSPAFTLPELREQPEELRKIADITLADALGLEPEAVPRPPAAARCRVYAPPRGANSTSFPLLPGKTTYGPATRMAVAIGLRRFASKESGELEAVPPGTWRRIAIPRDAASEPWRAVIDAPLRVCRQAGQT